MSTNIPTMNVKGLRAWLNACYTAGIPTMVYGPPGIGKSEIHAQFADDIGHALLEVRLSYFLPETMGPILYPDAANKRSIALKPAIIGMIEELHASTGKPVLVFLDEITTATSEVLKTALEFVLEKRIAGFKPSCPVHIVAAGNSPEDTPEAIYLPATHRTRLFSCLFKPTAAELTKHIGERFKGDAFAASVGAFVRTAEASRLMNAGPAADGIDPVPVPRSIVRAIVATSGIASGYPSPLKAMTDDNTIGAIWESAVGSSFWARMVAHATIAANSVNPADVLRAPRKVKLPDGIEGTTTALNQIADAVVSGGFDAKHIEAFLDYVDRLSPENVRVWSVTAPYADLFNKIGGTVRGKRTLQAWGVDLSADVSAARSR